MNNTAAVMNVNDTISAQLAQAFITIKGNRYNFMQMINFEASVKKSKTKVPILGKLTKGNKSGALDCTWKATVHYNQSVIRKMLTDYKDTGEDEYFEIQVINEGPEAIGNQTIIYKGCNVDGGVLSKFDANAEYLDEELTGTFEDWEMPESFNLLPGML